MIRIACEGSRLVALAELMPFQGELKTLLKEDFIRFRREILETGYAFPIRVWKDIDGANHIVGGHQTVRMLQELENEGYCIPPLPVSDVHAKDIIEAKRRVLQDASQYGTIERQGLYQFMIENGLGMGDIASSFKLPDLNLPSFGAEFFMDAVTGKIEGMPDGPEKKNAIFSHACPRCGFGFD